MNNGINKNGLKIWAHKVRIYISGTFYSLPVQLLLLHFKRYQILLIFWYILFATVAGYFMHTFGADALYLSPEYLGSVNPLAAGMVGISIGAFFMSWNITTFILHNKHLQFLATTSQPFLKYCINNSLLPIIFLAFYFFKEIHYCRYRELMNSWDIALLVSGFSIGLILSIAVAFAYFFGADKTIYFSMLSAFNNANKKYFRAIKRKNRLRAEKSGNGYYIRVDWFLSGSLKLRKPRDVRHYPQSFIDAIFKRHHFSAVLAMLIAFIFLIIIGYLSDRSVFQIPAAASITSFFAILIALAGALSIFLRAWSIPVLILCYLAFNWMYEHDMIDVRNKAYGINYQNKKEWKRYENVFISQIADPEGIKNDKAAFVERLNNWKKRQASAKPIMFVINVSGGGTRSATFVMNVLQRLDSITNGELMQKTFLITGASGGMFGATYFRELYWQKINGGNINLQSRQYVDDISKDLLNPLFLAFISRDLAGPAQKFKLNNLSYTKDRGYAFEQKLLQNTHGLLDKKLGDYTAIEDSAFVPSIIYNATISRDGRKLVMASRPARFLMSGVTDSSNSLRISPDAIDFVSLCDKQNALNLRITSALRMNATFPYVLPNVWLPTNPVIDVMDAGFRDNSGQETVLRFIDVFKQWLYNNTSGIVLIQIRDRQLNDWEVPYDGNDVLNFVTKPFLLLQKNWYKLQDYYLTTQLQYMRHNKYSNNLYKVYFQYVPNRKEASASLSFHLNNSEKVDIAEALNNTLNRQSFEIIKEIEGSRKEKGGRR